MLKIYTYRDDNGAGERQFSLMLDQDRMPICFDTLYDWAMEHLDPIDRNARWVLAYEEPLTKEKTND